MMLTLNRIVSSSSRYHLLYVMETVKQNIALNKFALFKRGMYDIGILEDLKIRTAPFFVSIVFNIIRNGINL